MDRPNPFRFTINDYQKILEKGVLSPSQKVEFIRGELYCILPKNESHNLCNSRLHNQLSDRVNVIAKIIGDAPIRLADSAPRSDLAILKLGSEYSDSRMVSPDELLVVIEVADETLEYDRVVKGAIYAENDVPEYWIVNLIDTCVEVYRDPRPDGTYATVQDFKKGDSLTLLKLPAISVAIADILP